MPKNYELVTKGFHSLLRAFAPYVCASLRMEYGPDWWRQAVLTTLHDLQRRGLPLEGPDQKLMESLDIQRCLILFDVLWGEVFRKVDPDKMFVTDANANAWRVARINRTDGLGCLVLRDCGKDFVVKCGRGAKKLCAFTSVGGNSFTVYIDAKNLEFFEDECNFFAANPYDMVFVTNGEIVGGVMPFVAKK